jgi:hypothetical protein
MAQGQDNNFQNGRQVTSYIGSIARTDTAAKTLFTLPAGFIPTNILVAATANSDAGTTATISVGTVGGAQTDFLNAIDVKAAGTGKGSQKPVASGSVWFGVPLAAAKVVTGIYAETGGASTTGGPWLVIVEGLQV